MTSFPKCGVVTNGRNQPILTSSGAPEPEKGQVGGQTFVEVRRQNFKHVEVLIREFKWSFAFFEPNMSPISSIYSAAAGFVITKAS